MSLRVPRRTRIERRSKVVWTEIGVDEAGDVAFDGEREARVLSAECI
jgi:hypothetical protein